ncbi:MAG: DsbE family thiol:disulfide interchange protein [Xanthomonadales bacterium]|nr:DsbE family thiol:disulfide interchange protein [Xanthomonadales bacterium]
MKSGGLKAFLPIGAFIGLVVIFYVGLFKDPTLVSSPLIGKAAPAFDLPSLHAPDQRVSNTDMAGDVALLNVWASWCPACVKEHELLQQIAATGTIPIYGLNWKDERADGLKWLQRLGNPYTAVAFDYDNVVGINWGVYGAPETFLLDADGIILHKLIGQMTPEIWQEEFLPLIEAARTRAVNSNPEEGTG